MKKTLLILLVLSLGFTTFAQRPKMHLKARFGLHFNSFIYKNENISEDLFYGYQGGFSFRVTRKKLMGEVGFDFVRSFVEFSLDSTINAELKLNAFELPVTMGYLTVKKPTLKHYLYGGFVARYNIKSFVNFLNQPNQNPLRLKPRELGLRTQTFAMRLGTQLDFYMFNLDLNYSIGLNSATKSNARTQTHNLQLNLGVVF